MKRFAVVAASARRAIARASLAAALALGLVGAACAGDKALLDVIGYSPDGRYFAFEEFGVQDGSGFPYAHIYVIDIETDDWAPGTPVRVRIDDESATLSDVRRQARSEAEAALTNTDAPVDVWALVGDGEVDAEARTIEFGRPSYERGAVAETFRLDLETFEAPAGEPCQDWFEQAALGYALTVTGPGGTRLVHRDGRIPRSRGCPFDYRIYAIVAPMDAPDLKAAVAILSVYPGGFEGPDRRFLAVPLGN